ncbi:MAG: Nitrate reductase-like protein NarX [Gemmatimonadaceae bacterium]|nr:Nitrate reductase-like protein NarX [Gemmatimonadaceae bacterium]
MFENFFFVGLPYVTLLLLVGGSIYRAFTGSKTQFRGPMAWSARGDFMWTTRSTGFFGRASVGPSALSLHWGLIILFFAHVAGFVGGAYGWASWVEYFRWTGLFGGVLVFYGLVWALVRRIRSPQLRAMSTFDDYAVLVLLVLIAGLGLWNPIAEFAFGVSYSVGPWFAGIFQLRPDASLVAGAPLVVRLHMILAMLFLCYLPFTKLVHAFSYPWGYMSRPYISMRGYFGLKK